MCHCVICEVVSSVRKAVTAMLKSRDRDWMCVIGSRSGIQRLFPFCLLLIAVAPLAAESRRPILVGINNYNPDPATQARLSAEAKPGEVERPRVNGDSTYWTFPDLEGPLNDVKLIKAKLQSFGVSDFVVLEDQDATADAILTTLQKNLVPESGVKMAFLDLDRFQSVSLAQDVISQIL
jgi:hypothetical protein